MQRRTKIVATLGPASEDKRTLVRMIECGMTVARLNFSHGDADEHRRRAATLKQAAREVGRDIGLLGDLQGPKIRVQRFEDHSVVLADGDKFFLDSTLGLNDGTKKGVGVALETLHEHGYLQAIYMMLASMPNFRRLVDRKNRAAQAISG